MNLALFFGRLLLGSFHKLCCFYISNSETHRKNLKSMKKTTVSDSIQYENGHYL
jgi:hypothetical protein